MKQIINLSDKRAIKEAVSILNKGGIIAFPTDTVYGIGCDADNNSAIKRIFKMKRRRREKPLVMFLPHKNVIEEYTKKLSPTRKRVCEHFLPGPLTLIVKAKKNVPPGLLSKIKTVSVRIPDCSFLKKLLIQFKKPLATTSANISCMMPARRYKDIDLDVDLKLVDDSILNGVPSTILDLSSYPFTLRRKGPISIFSIEKYIPSKIRIDNSIDFNILFICTGNSCRSPIAEGISRKLLKEKRLKNVNVTSCGIYAEDGLQASRNAILSADELGYDISNHYSRAVTKERVRNADLILCMENFQKKMINNLLTDARDKVLLLSEFVGENKEIEDPVGRDIRVYRRVTRVIERFVKKMVDEMEKRRRGNRE